MRERKKREFECEAEKENVIKEVEQKLPKAKAKKVKFPVEDLEVPLDLKSMFLKKPSVKQSFSVPQESVGTMLAIWNFLMIFGRSLFLSFCTLDDFELSLCHNVASPRCNLVVEIHVALLNAIIRDRWLSKGKKRQIVPRKAIARNNSNEEDSDSEDETYSSREILKILEQKWDKRLISLNDGRKGWVSVLIGCIQQLSAHESMPNMDSILLRLVSNKTNLEKDFEENFAILEVQDKLQILSFLINITAKTSVIHSHIENCVEKLTELNKEKNGIIKKKRQILFSLTEISNGNIPSESSFGTNVNIPSESSFGTNVNIPSESSFGTNVNEITSDKISINENELMAQKLKLEEEQATIQKREEEIEIEKRQYAFPRTTPLGYDRFYNKYYYFDCMGEAVGERYGAGRIFVEIPSTHDLQAMTEKEEQRFSKRRKVEENESNSSSTQWGYYDDASQVMICINEVTRGQGVFHHLFNTIKPLFKIDELQRWLNTKGSRELALNNELTTYYRDITSGMISSRTDQDLRRSRRTKVTLAVQSCMKWTNKLAQ
ncbi:20516_t:CDS:2 [Gigaspora margarita]|uniref:20516_t:CDS:1 n=1 Tax=Gigaspora margarita TaxID=4874 RepID=A0ABM8W313_GIGMA|nr:20516_t:CDS:2 [Gigaspora margarita]